MALFGYRARLPWQYLKAPLGDSVSWLLTSRETTNFTYDLAPLNLRYLAATVAEVTGKSVLDIEGYIRELEADDRLREHVRLATERSRDATLADPEPRFARRLGWYSVVRATKPRVVVETGVDKGLGACVLTAALLRNRGEGFVGRYFGTDINPRAGYLLSGIYGELGEILYGDSIESLRALDHSIDVFVSDSDHSPEYEAMEYEVVAEKLCENALILGDNSHRTDRLLEFAQATGRRFLFFQEQPQDHWYPGAGIGFAFSPPASCRSGLQRVIVSPK